MKVVIKTVGELIKELEKYPSYMNVRAKDGTTISNIHYNGKIPFYIPKDRKWEEKEGLIIE